MIVFGEENIGLEEYGPFLIELSEGEDNRLAIKVAIAAAGEGSFDVSTWDNNSRIAELISKSTPICPDYDNIYEIVFDRYIMYQVRNESYSSWDDYEIRRGRYFIVFEQSRLLDHLSVATDCQVLSDGSFYPDRWRHYGIYCQNHIIDVVSAVPPEVTEI